MWDNQIVASLSNQGFKITAVAFSCFFFFFSFWLCLLINEGEASQTSSSMLMLHITGTSSFSNKHFYAVYPLAAIIVVAAYSAKIHGRSHIL